jgi:hypothetical protein
MTSERQLQDRGNSNQEDSLGIQDAEKVSTPKIILKNSDPKDDREHSQKLDSIAKQLQDSLTSLDAANS